MKFIRGLIITLLFCAVLISPACAFQVYEGETYSPTENLNIGTEITDNITLVYEPKEAQLISSLHLKTELYNPKWTVLIGNNGVSYSHFNFTYADENRRESIIIPAFNFDYGTRIVELKITVVGTIQQEVTVPLRIEEYRDTDKLRNSYATPKPIDITVRQSSPSEIVTPTPETPEALYQMLYLYQEQITELSRYNVDVTNLQKKYDTIKSNIDNYASPKPQYTDKEIKSQIEGLKMDLLTYQKSAMEMSLNGIRGIISPDSAYVNACNQLLEKYNSNDYSGNVITQSINLYHAIEEENNNKTSSQITTVVLIIFVILILLTLLLIIRNKNRKEREF